MQTLTLEKTAAKDFTLCLLASFVICLSGQLSIPLWFTPVHISMLNAVVLLTGALLGSRRGSAAVFAFLVYGAMGLPVFSIGGSGVHFLLGPKGGYYIGFLIAAFVVGYMVEKGKNIISALVVGNLVIYLCGASFLASFVGWKKAFLLGVAPFLLGDLLKTIASVKIFQRFAKHSI